jgi:hypothetical protein
MSFALDLETRVHRHDQHYTFCISARKAIIDHITDPDLHHIPTGYTQKLLEHP